MPDAPASPPAADLRALSFRVRGMRCASCTGAVEAALAAVPGVASARVNLADETAEVRLEVSADAVEAARGALYDAVRAAGYDPLEPAPPSQEDAGEARLARRELLLALAALLPGGALMALMLDPHRMHAPGALLFAFAAATLVQLGPGLSFHAGAARALRAGRPNMDVLVSIGTTAAYALSTASYLGAPGLEGQIYFETSVLLMGFVRLGKWLEARARGEASRALRALLALEPERARRVRPAARPAAAGLLTIGRRPPVAAPPAEVVDEVPTAEVRPGDLLEVRPGERFPADGVIETGRTAADESLLTGEALPVEKAPGDAVVGGSVNRSGLVRVRARAVGAETALSRIVRLVRAAQADRPPIQRTADALAAIFVPAVLALGAATFAFWLFHGAARFGTPAGVTPLAFAVTLASAVVVVACPCALGLATPTAILVGSGVGLRRGILVKRASALEALARADVLLLDKTGTLTRGAVSVVDVVPAAGVSEEDLLRTAGALEARSTHPLARAVAVRAAPLLAAGAPEVESLEEEGGRGVAGVVARERCRVGSRAFLDEGFAEVPADLAARAEALASLGRTLVWVARGGEAIGALGLADEPRPEAAETVAALRALGLEVGLVTGDAPAVALRLARAVGIDKANVAAGVRPEGKRDALLAARAPRAPGGRARIVAFAGDGVNDAPALASADVGIAIGAGADVAKEAGDLVLARSDLRDLARAVRLGRATLAKVRQNLALALVYNLAAIPIAAGALWPSLGVLLRPEWAGLAMALSSVSVVGNALLLRRVERRL